MTANQLLRLLPRVALVALATGCGSPTRTTDAGPRSDSGPSADASPFGVACATSSDCTGGGYCIEGLGGHVCTYGCEQGCPETWQCRATRVDGTLLSVCVPPAFELCTPCTGDSQCGAGVCVTLGGQPFCLPDCPFEGECPQGYTCGPDPTASHSGSYCLPQTGGCTCTTGADDGLVRTCTNSNAIGSCQGLETCRPAQGGWVGCNAPSATPEQCDGLDNDCNMLIDDGLASGQACAITVPGVGSCPGITLCTGGSGVVCQGRTPQVETCNYTDDDCDMMVDENFPGVNAVCSAGVGGCERIGIVRCTSSGTGTQCSAVAGTPVGELCNGVDDDCDTFTDEAFATKGNSCTVGVGICVRQGNLVCNATGSALECSVSPGMPAASESCNSLDDDCDSKIDEDFRDTGTGEYNQDRACGSCAVDCTVQYGLPNASGSCVAGGSPTCVMTCDAGAYNLDGATANGCELVLDPGAIYVSTNDLGAVDNAGCGLGPVGTGAGNYPCKTIAQGITRANMLNRARVLVANGIYTEAVTLANGRSLLGGYRPDNWLRDVASTGTIIIGISSAGNHDRTVIASAITVATVFEGFVVYGAVNSKPGGNSYAIYVSGSNANLAIRNSVVFGGRGGPGSSGGIGGDGGNGADGSGRSPNLGVSDAAYDATAASSGAAPCDLANNRQYANGGQTTCGAFATSGGAGGGNRCPVMSTCATGGMFGCSTAPGAFSWNEYSALDGATGNPGGGGTGGAGGTGAFAGDDGIQVYATAYNGYVCYIPPSDPDADPDTTYGLDGANGSRGVHGGTTAGCSAATGSVSGGDWIGNTALTGNPGGNGGGGGGGGAGGGGKCVPTPGHAQCTDGGGFDTLGGHGGGGGAGGCGGAGGTGATAGGGAFGIFIVGTSAPVVTGNSIFRGEGGAGGTGGAGGKGGTGGMGALGGSSGVPVVFCSDTAGRGGNGGDGGHGSGGGGGCGGSSFGIYTFGVGAPSYCQSTSMNTFSGGSGGTGGGGGYSIISPGGTGSAGTLLDCSFN